jgi:PAS domain S-box-containing protein
MIPENPNPTQGSAPPAALAPPGPVATDIGDRKKAEEVRAYLAAIVDSSEDAIFGRDLDGAILTWNPGAERLFGYSAQEIVGQSSSILQPPDRTGDEFDILKRIGGGEAIKHYETELVRKDGQRIHVSLSVSPIWNAEVHVAGACTIARDVTERKLAEEVLHKQRQWLEVTLQSIGDAVLATDADGRVTFLNPVAAALTGWTQAQALGQQAGDVLRTINEQTREKAEDIIGRVLGEGCVISMANHTALVARDGREIPIEDSAAPIRDGAGHVLGVVLVFHDVTEKRRAHRELQNVLNSINDGLLVLDRNWRYTYFSEQGARMIGMRREDLIGGCVWELFPHAKGTEFYKGYHRAVDTGQPVTFQEYYPEPLNKWFECHCYPSEAGLSVYFQDITERRRAEEALRESESRLRTLSDNLPEGAIYRYRHDVHGEPHVDVISAGIERLTGVPAAEFLADAAMVRRSILPEDRDRLNAAIVLSRERLTRFELEVRHTHRATGEIRWSLMRSTPTRNPDGSTTWDGIELDITDRKRAEEEMAWLASFPERNANPIAEIEPSTGVVQYVNAAGRRLFPDLKERGFSHPWLAGLEQVAETLVKGNRDSLLREVIVGDRCYEQSANYIAEKARLRIYGIDITESKRAEEVLRESVRRERFLAGILEASEQPFAIGYPDGRLGICNRAYCELTGYSLEELQSISWTTPLTPAEWTGKERAALAELERTGKPVRYEKEYVRKDGRRVPVELLVHAVRDESGKAEFYYSFLTDITESKRIDEALRKSRDELELRVQERTEELSSANRILSAQIEERERAQAALHESEVAFRTLAESVPQLVWICNPDGLNVYFNPRWVEYTGLTLEESYGSGWNTPFHPDDRQAARRAWNHAVESGGTYRIESRLRRADGSYHWFLIRGVPSRDAAGRIVKWFGTCTDIDDLKRAEQEARSARERLALALKVGHSGTFEWDIRNNVNIWTPEVEELYGLEPGTFGGRYEDWEALVLPEDLGHARACLEESLKTGEFFSEWRIRPVGSGEIRWIVANAKVSFDEEGRPLRMIGFNRDITDRKLAEQEVLRLNQDLERRVAERTIELERIAAELEKRNREVERVNQMKSEFLARSSHELRTPLNAIVGYSDLLSEQSAGPLPPPYPRFVSNIQEGARHLLDMVNDLLDISRIEAGRIELNLERFDIAAALDEVLSVITPLAEIKRIPVENRVARGTTVVADRLRCKQILYNLTSNAVKFTPEEGRVWIETATDGEIFTICVADTGIGIAPDEQEAIFEEFHQVVASAGNLPAAGSGLGLAITRKLARLHGGDVRVESEMGKGSRFLVSLPVSGESIAP